jgi:hypothetical protein
VRINYNAVGAARQPPTMTVDPNAATLPPRWSSQNPSPPTEADVIDPLEFYAVDEETFNNSIPGIQSGASAGPV